MGRRSSVVPRVGWRADRKQARVRSQVPPPGTVCSSGEYVQRSLRSVGTNSSDVAIPIALGVLLIAVSFLWLQAVQGTELKFCRKLAWGAARIQG